MRYKPAERYKADFQKISKIFVAKILLTLGLLIFVAAWFGYWVTQ